MKVHLYRQYVSFKQTRLFFSMKINLSAEQWLNRCFLRFCKQSKITPLFQRLYSIGNKLKFDGRNKNF